MIKIGLIREGKTPADTRVALTPMQCADVLQFYSNQIQIVAEPSPNRCFPDAEYIKAGVTMQQNLQDCDVILGIKEVKIECLIPGKTFFFFSHTKKKQPYNQLLMHALIEKRYV